MKQLFQIAGGSIIGFDHIRLNKNNQDGYHWLMNDKAILGVVCDGCSNGSHSEVGASLFSRYLCQAVEAHLPSHNSSTENLDWNGILENARHSLLIQLKTVSEKMDGNPAENLINYFLFTIIGFVITLESAIVFSLGDGCYAMNGKFHDIPTYTNNEPPYLAYGLFKEHKHRFTIEQLKFKVLGQINTKELESLLIGSDGVLDLHRNAQNCFPGKNEIIGSIAQFWLKESYFLNPDQIRRTLALMNRTTTRPDPLKKTLIKSNPLLPDDTTLIVIRRNQTMESEESHEDLYQ